MGTDITMYAEKRVNGKWEKIGYVFKNDWEDDYTDHPYEGRNYDLFAVLVNVTNYNNFNPISKQKGFPNDISEDVKEHFYDNDWFGCSYLSLKELKEYNWEQDVRTVSVPTTYKECCEDFYKETIPALEQQIPDGGSDEDVRILFAFD